MLQHGLLVVMEKGITIFYQACSLFVPAGIKSTMKEHLENMILQIRNGQLAGPAIEELIGRLRTAIAKNPDQGKELGRYFSLIKQAQKAQASAPGLNWVAVQKGYLAIGHKPGGKIAFEGLKAEGVTDILTLLQENEGALLIGQQVQKACIGWIWFPFSASCPHSGEALQKVVGLYEEMKARLAAGGKIYIHCSAGIHRTGMISYGLLRYLGQDKEEAKGLLLRLRPVTAQQVGEARLAWGDQFGKG